MARVLFNTEEEEEMCDHLIGVETTVFTEGPLKVTWTGFSDEEELPSRFKAEFTSQESAKIFEETLQEVSVQSLDKNVNLFFCFSFQGKEYAYNSGIEGPTFNNVPHYYTQTEDPGK